MKLAIAMFTLLLLFSGLAAEEALFFVTDVEGDTLFAVYPNGVVIKNEAGDKLFTAESDSIRAYVYDDPGGRASRGGFAIGGVASATRSVNDYFHVSSDSVRIYLEDDMPGRASRGGFAIGGVASATRNNDYYFNLERSMTPEVITPSQPRMLWYPAKEAIRMGRVLVVSPDSVGQNSLATGFESKAIGDYSQALGYRARAVGDYSTAIGYNAVATGDNTYALGDGARAIGTDSFALGFGATSEGQGSFAFGSVPRDSLGNAYPGFSAATSQGEYSTAFGLGAFSNGVGAMAFGLTASASEYCALAMGRGASAEGSSSVAIGTGANATHYNSVAMGSYAEALAENALALGYFADATGPYATAIGRQAVASGDYSFCSATNSEAAGQYSVAMGRSHDVQADYAFAGGSGQELSGMYATAFGRNNNILGNYGTALGGYNTVSNTSGVALGDGNTVAGVASFAAGDGNETTANYSTAIGRDNTSAYGAAAIGYGNNANGQESFAAGRGCQTTSNYGVALGYYSTAGQEGFAAGRQSTAGSGAVALGYMCQAPDSYSVALGYRSEAHGQSSVAIGDNAISDGGGVAIGEDVSAQNHSVAMGRNVDGGVYMGSFLFGDYDSTNILNADDHNQFRARCKGGFKFHTNGALDPAKSVVISSNEGWVGIGSEDPESNLHIEGEETNITGVDGVLIKLKNTYSSAGAMSGVMFQNGTSPDAYKGGIFYRDYTSGGRGNMLFCTRNTTDAVDVNKDDAAMTIYYSGNVGIGTPPDAPENAMLTVNGRVAPFVDNAHDLGWSNRRWQDIYAVNPTVLTSDRRLKENIADLRYGLAEVLRLRPVSFTWIDDPERGEQLGLIAQDVMDVIPEMVVCENPEDNMGLRYTELIPVLVGAVQEQQVIIEHQQAELDAVAGLNDELDASNERVAQLESELAELREMVEQLAVAAQPSAQTAKLP